jgi:methylisocitrate lyase
MSALLAQRAGFDCVYLSGAALTASMGLPDLGLLDMHELSQAVRCITRVSQLAVVVDGDTGYGEALNCMRLVHELEDAGASAVQLEDQRLPKKCGHLNDKRLVSEDDMCRKIAAAKRAADKLSIIARTDAAADSLDDAIHRAKAYVDAGADIIFPEALTSEADFRLFDDAIDQPLLANMTEFGRTPYRTASEFEALGFAMVIWPVSSLRVAAKAIESLYRHAFEKGETHALLSHMQTRQELYDLIGYTQFEALDGEIALSVIPETPAD